MQAREKSASIVLGGGCFWCLEALYQRLDGVLAVQSGYAGGTVDNPTYEEVCRGTTGHTEVVEVTFDPDRITLRELIDFFWEAHDPTTLNRQGADVGTQYRSAVYYRDSAELEVIEASKAEAAPKFKDPIVTEIAPLQTFYPAEAYHDDYFNQHREAPYCRFVIAPKVKKLEDAQS
jgi:peptide-methionine (S)-S-oxide reductase